MEATSSQEATAPAKAPRKKSGGLNSMLLPELKQLAGSLGIKGVGGMRKSALVDAITAAQSGAARPAAADANGASDRRATRHAESGDKVSRDDAGTPAESKTQDTRHSTQTEQVEQ